MLFVHDDIMFALGHNLNNPKQFALVYNKLVEERPDGPDKRALGKDYPQLFKSFLVEDLPPAEEVPRIVARLESMARDHGATISEFRWWEIRPRLRALMAQVWRDDRTCEVRFYWKDSVKGEAGMLGGYANQTLRCSDPSAVGGWRVDFEAQEYHEVREQFRAWLDKPGIAMH